VDARKKEIVGPYKNGGGEYRPRGDPEQVNVHDFIDPDLGKARPVRGLRHRRQHRIGKAAYPGAAQLFSFVSMNWRDRHLTRSSSAPSGRPPPEPA
jgi:hypothetical protein